MEDVNEIVTVLEEEYGILIPDEDAQKIKTVGDAEKYIKKHVKK